MRECPACKLCFPDTVSQCPNDGEGTFQSIDGEPTLDSRYQLLKRLGQGGMGVVYKARHSYLKTSHAIKVILPDLVGNDPNLVTRFRQEALAAAAIRHRNIVSVTDFGVVDGKMPFLVMEFVEGEALHDLLLREKRLSPAVALEFLSAICSGLAAAHRQGIVHRDLKPLNVMILNDTPLDDAVKLLDFGLAKIKSGELLGSFVQAQTTGLMGSPYYMSPEQWSDDEPDARADVYSLGVMLYQMLAGDVPFKGSSMPSIMRKHLTEAPPPMSEMGVVIPPEVERVVQHALEKDPERRTASAQDLIKEFRQALRNAGVGGDVLATGALPVSSDDASSLGVISGTEFVTSQPNVGTTLRVLTNPPHSFVFLNGAPLGTSEATGWLTVQKIPRGKHALRVARDGYADFETIVDCNDETCQIIAQLSGLPGGIAARGTGSITETNLRQGTMPGVYTPETVYNEQNIGQPATGNLPDNTSPNNGAYAFRSNPEPNLSETVVGAATRVAAVPDALGQTAVVPAIVKPARPLVPFAIAAVVTALMLGVGGFFAYRSLIAPAANQTTANTTDMPGTPGGGQNGGTVSTVAVKASMAQIPGGVFQMGRNDGNRFEQPAHQITIKPFQMDKTEVTNEEYLQFVTQTGHPAPSLWVNGKPLPEQIQFPVVSVSQTDAKKFAEWRSKRDSVTYRLPTEEEWEYAARNGASGNFFPWGSIYEEGRAAINLRAATAVGSHPNGQNKWGVHDLIGNVWEWTDTPLKLYAGNNLQLDPERTAGLVIVRGGSCFSSEKGKDAISSTSRNGKKPDEKNDVVGFRLVRADS